MNVETGGHLSIKEPMASPIVMVPKPDGTFLSCNDFRKVDECSECLGRTQYISNLDLTKGYWQLTLTAASQEKMVFITPNGHRQYQVLPFGVHGAPATFQCIMDILLIPYQAYAATYLDDVVIHSDERTTWTTTRKFCQSCDKLGSPPTPKL